MMKFKLKNPFKRSPVLDQKSHNLFFQHVANVGRGTFTEFLLGMGGRMRAKEAVSFYQQSSAVSMAIDKIAEQIEQIEPVLRTDNGKFETDHEILDLINNPNGFESRQEFIGAVARNYLLTHDSIVYAEGSISSAPISIWAVKPQAVNIQEDRIDNYPDSYHILVGPARGRYKRLRKDNKWRFTDSNLREIYQIKGFSSSISNTFADSPLEAIALEVRQQILGRYHNLKLLQNGARLSLVAIFGDTLDEDQLDARKQALNETLAGPNNAGKIAVINADELKLEEFGINNKDMDFINLDKVAFEAIMNRYGVPLPLVRMDASTFNNMENAVTQFFDGPVLQNFQTIYSGLGKMLLPRYGLDPAKFELTYNPDSIDALRKRHIDELSKLIKDGVITINEYRDKIRSEAVAGGDEILWPANMIPVAQDIFTLENIDNPEEEAARARHKRRVPWEP